MLRFRTLVVAALLLLCGCIANASRSFSSGEARITTPLLSGWRFHLGDVAGAQLPSFDDRKWNAVALPHSWNALGEYRLERTAATRNVQGIGWYRLTIDAAALPERRRHILQFDAVGNVADVWVNGVKAGRHVGAFSRFRFDITDLLHPGRNVIAVRADNSRPEPGSSTEHVIPLLGDFFIHGGLYRGVALVSTGDATIDLLDHGGPGVYARTVALDETAAEIEVLTRLRNAGAPRDALLDIAILDAEGARVAGTEAPVHIAATREVRRQIRLDHPRRWDGRRDPYRYRLVVSLRDGARLLDRVEQPLGIRAFRIDPDRGFFLNGRRLPLHGVSRHQDILGRGWALTRADHERDMALIEEIGANTVRFAHYQHAEDWFELADEAGMIVWAELPFVNKLAFGDAHASPELIANARQQMIELIRQNYNHPSIVTWGIGNEVDIDLAFGRLGPRADPRPLLDMLHRLSRAEDPSRPTVIADCCEATPGDKVDYLAPLAGHADLMGYNRYFGWYYGKVDDLGPHLDMLHARHRDIPISVSEYGAGGALTQHSDNPRGGPINAGGRPHPEEFQSWWHEQSWPQVAARDYLWASWIWNMFDFSSVVRHEGDATDINDKGLVSFDRKVRKDAFLYYKAQWSDAPVLHITGRRYVDRAYPVTDVRIYSNAERVALSLDGRDLGTAPCPGRVCVFPGVALDAGANRLIARATIDGAEQRDRIEWSAPDAAAGLAINVGDLTGFVDAGGHRWGSDNWFVGGTAHRIGGEAAAKLHGAGHPRARTGYREGSFRYAIPLPSGRWRVTLLFLEPDAERAAPRRFDVGAEGRTVLADVEPVALKGVERGFIATVDDGTLDLDFTGEAVLSGIEVRPFR